MASDEKDRYGDKLRDLEKARENNGPLKEIANCLPSYVVRPTERTAGERQDKKASRVFSRILCPIDFEQDSLSALDLAGRLVSQNDADLYLLHVCSTVFVPLSGPVMSRLSRNNRPNRRWRR